MTPILASRDYGEARAGLARSTSSVLYGPPVSIRARFHRQVTPIRYDNHGSGLSYPASHDNETPVYLRGPAFLVRVHLRDRMSGVWGEADVVRDAPNDRL